MALPAALLVCGEPFLCDARWSAFLSQVSPKNPSELSLQTFYLSEADMDSVLAQAKGLPFLVSAQVFRIKEAEKLKDLEPLERYLEKPFAQTCLYFESVSMAKDSALAKLIGAQKGKVEFLENPKEGRESGVGFIKQKLKQAGKTLTADAAEKLEELGQVAPSFLDAFVEKLILNAGDKNEITVEAVESFHEKLEETDVFQLTNALFAQRPGQALTVLKKLLAEDEKELIPLLGFLHWQVRRLWQARVLMEDGLPEAEILRKCKVYGKQAPFFTRQMKQFKRVQLEKALEGLFQIDWKLKTGQMEGDLGLEIWIMEFSGGQAAPAQRT